MTSWSTPPARILKVKEIEDVAQPGPWVWSEQGINICLCGIFDRVAASIA